MQNEREYLYRMRTLLQLSIYVYIFNFVSKEIIGNNTTMGKLIEIDRRLFDRVNTDVKHLKMSVRTYDDYTTMAIDTIKLNKIYTWM